MLPERVAGVLRAETPALLQQGHPAVDELVEMTGLDDDTARGLIMKAREQAHWFEDADPTLAEAVPGPSQE